MTLYFDILPIDLRRDLLLCIPQAYLIYEYNPSQFARHVFNIFDLNTFKPCDTEYLWKELYGKYSSQVCPNYKDSYRQATIDHIQQIRNLLYLELRHGREHVVKCIITSHFDLWLDYEDAFVFTTTNLHFECMKVIDKYVKLDDKTYQSALNDLCTRYYYLYIEHLEKFDAIISYLVEHNATLPPMEFTMFTPRIGNAYLFSSWINKGFIDFVLKYYPEANKKQLLKYLCSDHINADVVKYFIEKNGQIIDSEIFQYVARSRDFSRVKLLLDLRIFPDTNRYDFC